MLKRSAEFVFRFRWFIIVFWLIVLGLTLTLSPTLSDVTKDAQESFLPKGAYSLKATELLKELFPEKAGNTSLILVFERKGGLKEEDRKYGISLEEYLEKNSEKLKIAEVVSPFTNKDVEAHMLSKDKEAALTQINLKLKGLNETTRTYVKDIREKIKNSQEGFPSIPQNLSVNITGDASIIQEEHDAVNESMDLTTKITIILVAVILILIYRSPVAPIVTLFTIGLSFMISCGLVATFAEHGFKVSSFTETFLVAVLFGAGTDYCLLLISRFKEELSSGKEVKEALLNALPATSEAIISSGGTVIVGFSFMYFAKFGLFNTTGPSVAIGVIITLIAVMTLTPAVIAVLGKKIFWPTRPGKSSTANTVSGFWLKLSSVVTQKPMRFIIGCLILFIPFLVSLNGIERSYDQLNTLPDKADSKIGFNVMKKHFDQGTMLPIKVVLKTDKDMWSNESLQALDALADDLLKIDRVASVRTATRPDGNKPPILVEMIDEMKKGVDQAAENLSKGNKELSSKAEDTKSALTKLGSGLTEINQKTQEIISGYEKINQGLLQVSTGISQSQGGMDQIFSNLETSKAKLEELQKKQPALKMDPDFMTAYMTLQQITAAKNKTHSGFDQLKSGISQNRTGLSASTGGLTQVNDGIGKIVDSLNHSKTNLLNNSGGNNTDINLSDASEGFNELSENLTMIKEAVTGATNDESKSLFYLPEIDFNKYPQQKKDMDKLKNAMALYIPPKGTGASMDVILSIPPYTSEALDKIDEIKNLAAISVKDTILKDAEVYVGGPTSVFNEVRDLTAEDFIKVMLFVLLGIFIVLTLLLRSLIAPIYLLLTIIVSFATTMGISYLVFQVGLGYEGLNWSTPFFSFCLLVALGVDYNIFLMSRVKEEYKPGDVKGAVSRALTSTGSIITSCGIIMAGTFGAMLASPLINLVEVGFAAVVGLLLDTFIVRSLLVPAIAVKVGELNWWPGRKVKVISAPSNEHSE
ncbi:MAG: MMPL family transporter [Clostridia bacterium]|nr:MMPL family transporter [Clostridia bacterium]